MPLETPTIGQRVKVLFHPVCDTGYGPLTSALGTVVSIHEGSFLSENYGYQFGEVVWDGCDFKDFMDVRLGSGLRRADPARPPNVPPYKMKKNAR